MNSKAQIIYPLLLAGALALGVYVGTMVGSETPSHPFRKRSSDADKFSQVVRYVEREYVDSVDVNAHVEKAIQDFLQDLDPHSYYISAAEIAEYSEPLQGNFDGIGVEFRIVKDTVMVINPISGGPSESVGIHAGDRIVTVEDSSIAGVDIDNRKVMELLRGERGTKVRVGILRVGTPKILNFTITRGEIPIVSVPVALKVDDQTGFIRISRFGRTTYDEFEAAMQALGPGIKKLIIDLRGNGGGYLQTAIELADEFLDNDELIVYTEGRNQDRRTYEASRKGNLADVDVVILINENSASASEILAGAIQDNDRGMIIGRRSFGKGLVQQETSFDDKSAMRLTIARYYTPTGRSIQKPYGKDVDYENDYFERLERGELLSADSISFPDSLKYVTAGGRIVYGGGGIMPDIFVAVDTTRNSGFLTDVIYNGVLTQFAFGYADQHREELKSRIDPALVKSQLKIDHSIFEDFLDFAEESDFSPTLGELARSREELEMRLKAEIARVIWGESGYFQIYLDTDSEYKAALKYLNK
jgi:carboxyl-terminal processing protease